MKIKSEFIKLNLKYDDQAEKHPKPLPRIIVIDDKRNILVYVFFHPQLTPESSNRAQNDENYHTPDNVDVHFLFELRSLIARSTVVKHCLCLVTCINNNSLNVRCILKKSVK